VNAGQTLTIEPGSSLLFEPGTGLSVYGVLIADAGSGATILFSSSLASPTNGSWDQIYIGSGQPRTVLNNVEIAFARNGLAVDAWRDVPHPQVVISNSVVHSCRQYGVTVAAGPLGRIDPWDVFVVSNRVHNNGSAGVYLQAMVQGSDSSNATTVCGNELYSNGASGIRMSADVGGIYIYPGSRSWMMAQVSGNFIHGNQHGGMQVTAMHNDTQQIGHNGSSIRNNLIVSNEGSGVLVRGPLSAENLPSIMGNTIAHNLGTGVYYDGAFRAFRGFGQLRNNVVVSNAMGIRMYSLGTPADVAIGFNDVFGHGPNNWVNYPPEFGVLSTNNLTGQPADIYQNISRDPLFAGPCDFHLRPGSPCINAGTTSGAPADDYDGQPRVGPPDIGAFEVVPEVRLQALAPVTNNTVRMTITGQPGLTYGIEATARFTNWTEVTTLFSTNATMPCEAPAATNGAWQFYRARVLPY
jgi:hypothetical protein